MFLTADLQIDPSQITVIKRINNDNMLFKLYDILTANVENKSIEQETFTVISILNQIQMGLMRMNVDNVVRINVDNFDYFYDTEGVEHDLFEAFISLEKKIDPMESQRFNLLELVLEHEQDGIKYLIDVKIKRKHKVGEYPINIRINGAFEEMMIENDQDISFLKSKMKPMFEDQNSYDRYVKEKELSFKSFINEFENTLSKFIKVNGIKLEFVNKILRPKLLVEGRREIRENKKADPFFHGFVGINRYMTYTLYWGSCCSNNNIHVKNFTLCDDYGKDIFAIGDTGFNAGELDILKPQNKLSVPSIKDIVVYSDHDFLEEFEKLTLKTPLLELNDEDIFINYIDLNLEFEEGN
jgi:hypothetical protein